jgi:hypothetical protein
MRGDDEREEGMGTSGEIRWREIEEGRKALEQAREEERRRLLEAEERRREAERLRRERE